MKFTAVLLLTLCMIFSIGCTVQTSNELSSDAESSQTVSSDITSENVMSQEESSLDESSIENVESETSDESGQIEDTSNNPNADFSLDKVAWYELRLLTVSLPWVPPMFAEEISAGLMTHVHDNAEQDIWYCVGMTTHDIEDMEIVDDYLEKYGFVPNDEYKAKLKNTDIYRSRVGYVSAECLLELEKVNFNLYCTWLPEIEKFDELYYRED